MTSTVAGSGAAGGTPTNGSSAPSGASTIDWSFAESVAVRSSRRTHYPESPAAVTMPAELRTLTEIAQDLVEEFCGLRSLAGPARSEVIDRPRWIRSNIEGFRHLLEPLAERLTSNVDLDTPFARAGREVGRKMLGGELGLFLGFLSQRVLGQYDLILAEEAASAGGGVPGGVAGPEVGRTPRLLERSGETPGGVVYYVGPNILGLERRYGFPSRDFRMWIALHEVTHRTQFTAVAWLRSYFLELVDGSLGAFEPGTANFGELIEAITERIRAGRRSLAEDGIMGLFATDEQRVALDRMQALMTLLEGHGNAVMDALGKRHVNGQAYMAATLQQRRHPTGLSRIVMRILGMDMKMRQYEEGQRFVEAVLERCGPGGLDPAWSSPDALPTLSEIRADPEVWIGRVAGAAVH